MFIAALFTTAKTGKQPKHPPTDTWIKKMWHKYTIQYYSAMKNEILRFRTAWMDLVGVTLSEITQRKTKAV